VIALVGGWLVVVSTGMAVITHYGTAPGVPARAAAAWPDGSSLVRAADRPTLVLLIHPLCPCSRATIAELARLMTRLHDQVDVEVLFLMPRTSDAAWEDSDLRTAAARIPGVRIHDDVDGEEIRRFGAFTSGQALLYGADGRLRFAGGITDGRGHEGGNFGLDAIVDAVAGDVEARASTPVFGCALVAPPSRPDARSDS
jgi:hypothetical protein